MVYWIICTERPHTDRAPGEDKRRFGPFESEERARRALAELRATLMGATSGRLDVVCDFA